MFAVLFDETATSWDSISQAIPQLHSDGKPFPVTGGASLHRALACLAAPSANSHQRCVLNLCHGSDGDGGVSAVVAALLLEHAGVSYSGCRAGLLVRSLDVLFMMTWYAGLPLPPFAVVSTAEEATAAAARLTGPLQVRAATPIAGSFACVTGTAGSSAAENIAAAVEEHGRLVVWEDVRGGEMGGNVAFVLVSGGDTKGAIAVSVPAFTGSEAATVEAQLRQWGGAFAKDVMYFCGTALLTFTRCTTSGSDAVEQQQSALRGWVVVDIRLNPSLTALPVSLRAALEPSALLRDMAADAAAAHIPANFEVRLNTDSRKGYSLCATRAIKKGEIIFADERRSFAVVTRPHVEANWDRELKQTFSEYAWPLDSEGHLYAIWEEEPTRWRPMNHSCDPACIFDAPHSLNVIAARDIAAGEDLSMDYATFCDHTMRPFQCLCGAACCRGQIAPDEAVLAKYGKNAWLRRLPPPVKPL